MKAGTLYRSTTTLITIDCYKCGVLFGMPDSLNRECLRDHSRNFYCPNGHGQVYAGETEEQKLKRRVKWAEDSAASARARADQAEASLRTTKGHVTRLRNRARAGVCPFGCKRHFTDLERHVASKHAGQELG